MPSEKGKGVSIFLRILLCFMLVNICTSSILIFLAYNFSRDSTERRTKQNVARQIETIHEIFNHQYVRDLKRSLNTLAASSVLDDYLNVSEVEKVIARKKLERKLLRLLDDFPSYQSAAFVDATGEIVTRVVDGVRQRSRINLKVAQDLPDLAQGNEALEAFRQVFHSLEAVPVALSSGYMEWFMPPREVAIYGPLVDANGAVSFVAGVSKVDLDTGMFGGVVLIQQRLDEFFTDLRNVTFFDENTVWVFDGRGEVLQKPENLEATFDPRRYLPKSFQPNLRIANVESGLAAFQDFSIAPGTPLLRVALGIPSELLIKDFNPVVRFFSLVLVCSLSVVIAAALYVSRYLSRPIQTLAAAAARLAGGDLKTHVQVNTTGEVQVLVDSFNQMTAQLRDTIASRDESVRSLSNEVGERKRAEEQLKQQAKEITDARIAAEEASRAKSDFLAKMSHEIRTPMIGVLGMSDLLARCSLAPRQQRLVGVLRQSAETLLSIINDILDFSRIEAGKLKLEQAAFDLPSLIADVVELLAEWAQSKGLEVNYAIADDVPVRVVGDPHRLRQVLMNLIGNAIKFTEDGEVEISVASVGGGRGEVELAFRVRDTGSGIDAGVQADLFEAFEQGGGPVSRKSGGTGLGLSIAKQLVTMMGGNIEMEATSEAGSTFLFSACFGIAEAEAETGAAKPVDLAGVRVLLVDDNATTRRVLGACLDAAGADCAQAASGEEALAALKEAAEAGQAFDVAVLDQVMPAMDGERLAAAVVSSDEIAATRLVLLTPIGWDQDRDPAVERQHCTYLSKPVRPEDLRREIAYAGGRLERPSVSRDSARTQLVEDDVSVNLKARVLFAEDNPVNQEVGREYLQALGCKVDIVETGAAAVAGFDPKKYDLVLMDCQMPEMDGFEAARLIRDREERNRTQDRVPIIAVTAFTAREDRKRCFAAGMDDYLSKPFDQQQLRDVLLRWLDADSADGAAERGARRKDNEKQDLGPALTEVVLDRAALDKLRGFDRKTGRGLLPKLIDIFLAQSPQHLEALGEAVKRDDAAAAAKLAHGLKGSSANVGALRLAELLKQLEACGRNGKMDRADALLARIDAEFANVRAALEAETAAGEPLSETG